MFAVCEDLTTEVGEIVRHHPDQNYMVISIARAPPRGVTEVKQWCPPLSPDDKKEIFNYLNLRGPKHGHYVVWYAL